MPISFEGLILPRTADEARRFAAEQNRKTKDERARKDREHAEKRRQIEADGRLASQPLAATRRPPQAAPRQDDESSHASRVRAARVEVLEEATAGNADAIEYLRAADWFDHGTTFHHRPSDAQIQAKAAGYLSGVYGLSAQPAGSRSALSTPSRLTLATETYRERNGHGAASRRAAPTLAMSVYTERSAR